MEVGYLNLKMNVDSLELRFTWEGVNSCQLLKKFHEWNKTVKFFTLRKFFSRNFFFNVKISRSMVIMASRSAKYTQIIGASLSEPGPTLASQTVEFSYIAVLINRILPLGVWTSYSLIIAELVFFVYFALTIIGVTLSEPHTSGTALQKCVL